MARTRKSIQSLDLYKYDVLIEDIGPRSDYFKITQFDGHFYGGRNAFLLAGANNILKTGTKILVEVLNKDGTTVFSAPVSSFIEGDSRLIQIEVYDDTPIGAGKIVILGCTETYIDGTPVPSQWKDKYNVRWITDVIISPTLPNNTKIRFVDLPDVTVTEKFYFAPSSSLFSRQATQSIDLQISPKNFNVYQNGYVIKSSGDSLTSKLLDGVVTGSIRFVGPNGSETASINLPITKIYNSSVAESEGQLIYTNKDTLISGIILSSSNQYTTLVGAYGDIGVTSSIHIAYNELQTYYTGSANSYAQIRITDLSTLSGEIYKVRISYKSSTSPSNYVLLGDVNLQVDELLTTDSGSNVVDLGKFNNIVIDDYWYAVTMSVARNDTNPIIPDYYVTSSISTPHQPIVQDSTSLLDSVGVIFPITNGTFDGLTNSYFIGNKSTAPITLFPRSEYTLSFEALASIASQSIGWQGNDNVLEVYLIEASGSSTKLYDTNPKGQLLGSLTPSENFRKQNFEKVEFNFTPKIIQSGDFYLRFVVYGAFWNIANVSVKPATEKFFSPDEVTLTLPNDHKYNELLTFRTQFLDVNNNSINIESTSLPTYFAGFHKYVERDGDTMSGELYINEVPIRAETLQDTFTGLQSGGQLSINSPASWSYSISAGSGYVVDNYTDPLNPVFSYVTWSQMSKIPNAFVTSSGVPPTSVLYQRTGVGIDKSGSIVEVQDGFNTLEYRNYIVLGRLVHVNTKYIQRTLSLPLTVYSRINHWFELVRALEPLNIDGNVYSAADANLQIQKSAGETYRLGSNYKNDTTRPDATTDQALNPATFAYRYRSGSGAFIEQPATTYVTGSWYDNGSGTLQVVNNNQWTIQRIYFFGATATTRIQYGQAVYNSLLDAEAAISNEVFVTDPNLERDASLRSLLILQGAATDLSNPTQAKFIATTSGIGGAPGGATSLGALSDVIITSAQTGDLLKYDGAEWINSKQMSGSYGFSGSLGVSGSLKVQNALEKNTVYATGMGTSLDYDTFTQSVIFYSGSATNNCTVNFRGDASIPLDTLLSIGQSVTVVLLVTNDGVAYYPNLHQIDGNSITPKWINGLTPSAGNPNSIDAYTYTIIKTASATFTVLASQATFA